MCQSLFFNKISEQSAWTTASVAYQKVLGIEFSKLEKNARMNTRKPNYHNLHRGWTIVILINYLFYQFLWEFVTKWICSNKRNYNTRNNNFLSASKISFTLLLISIMIKMRACSNYFYTLKTKISITVKTLETSLCLHYCTWNICKIWRVYSWMQ